MTDNQSEIRVKRDNVETALDAPALDEDLFVNLDRDVPTVGLPTNVDVRYQDAADEDDEMAADGGTVSSSRVATTGFALTSNQGWYASSAGAFALAVAGYLWGIGGTATSLSGISAFATLVAGAVLLYVGSGAYWRGLSQ